MATLAPPVPARPAAHRKSRDPQPGPSIGLWVFLYLVIVLAHSQQKLWYDEIFSYYMALLPNLGAVWGAMRDGADLNPLLFQLATRASLRTLGSSDWAVRTPAMVGFLAMSLCLYRFVTRRLGWQYGLAAMAGPAVTGAFRYAWEARPYGMVMGFAGVALVCWQEAAAVRTRRAHWLAGMTASIACALLSHAWAILLLVPLASGEVCRLWRTRRPDWTLWACLAAGSTAVLGCIPLLALAKSVVFGSAIFKPSFGYIGNTYEMLAAPALWPLLGALVLFCLWTARRDQTLEPSSGPGFQEHETAAAVAFLAIPAVAVALSMAMSSAYMNRYGLLGGIGISLVAVALAHRATAGSGVFGLRLAVLLIASTMGQFAFWIHGVVSESPPPGYQSAPAQVASLPPPYEVRPDLPFVSSSGLQFLELDRYAPPQLRSRLVYLQDRDAALRFTRSNVYEQVLPVVAKWFPVKGRLTPYSKFLATHDRFLVYGPYFHSLDWLIQKLIEDGAELRMLGTYRGNYGDNLLLEVTSPRGVK